MNETATQAPATGTSISLPRVKSEALFFLLLVAGSVFFLTGISRDGILIDEGHSRTMASYSFIDLLRNSRNDLWPILYYCLLHFWVDLFGTSLLALRSLSALFAVAFAALGAFPVRRLFGSRAGLLFTFIILISPGVFFKAQEARGYTLAALLTTACALYGYLAIRSNRRRDWLLFGLCSLGAAYTFYFSLLAVGVIMLLMFAWLFKRQRELLRPFLLTAVLVVLAYLPWLVLFVVQLVWGSSVSWISEITPRIAWQSLIYPFAYHDSFPDPPPTTYLAIALLWGLALFATWRLTRRKEDEARLLAACLITYLSVLLLAIVFSLAYQPVLWPRYMFPLFGLLVLPAAVGLASMSKRVASGGAILLLLLAVPVLYLGQTQYFNGPIDKVRAYLDANLQAGDGFIATDVQTYGNISYYYPEYDHFLIYDGLKHERLAAYLREHNRVWLLACEGTSRCVELDRWAANNSLELMGEEQRFSEPYSWLKIKVAPAQLAR